MHAYDDVLVSYHPPLKLTGLEISPVPIPDSGGLHVTDTLVIPFNNAVVAEKLIKKNRDEVAALIMEPIMFNIGCALPKDGYLKAIREITENNNVLLIFDEVRTGFRVAPGGAQQYYGVFIEEGFRNMGIGTRLTEALIEVARQRGFEILELAVYDSSERAFHIYKKCGFQEVGRIKRGVKLPDGTYTEKIIMILPLGG